MKYTLLICLVACLGACVNRPIGMANPASEFCAKNGGKSQTLQNVDGEYALCHLLDGQVIEEWQYYRQHHTNDQGAL